MRVRLLPLVLFALLCWPQSALAYPWPIKPFDKQHVIRANFGDPRTRFWNTLLTDGIDGPGLFQFHNGIDIPAPEGTPVYPVISGRVKLLDDTAVSVRTKGHGTFQYFHLIPAVLDGEHVVVRRTLLGWVMRAYEHLHFTEIRGQRVWNPLARGGIAPYRDGTVPEVSSISLRRVGSVLPLDTAGVCGNISIAAAAFDPPSLRLPSAFADYAVSPALLTWTLRRVGGRAYVSNVPIADFRTTLPPARRFWDVYARGSFQNSPRFSNRQFFIPGRYYYNLSTFFHTGSYPNGLYEIDVHASDMRGNSSDTQQRFTIANRPDASCAH